MAFHKIFLVQYYMKKLNIGHRTKEGDTAHSFSKIQSFY